MDLQGKIKQILEDEFEEVEESPFLICQVGRKYAKKQNHKQAQQLFDERFNGGEDLYVLNGPSKYFEGKLEKILFKNPNCATVVQGNDLLELTQEDALGTYLLIKKRLNKQLQNPLKKKKILLHSQNKTFGIEFNPQIYNNHIKAEVTQEIKAQPFEETYKLFTEMKKQKPSQRVLRSSLKQKEVKKNGEDDEL